MQIIFGTEIAEELRKKHTVLELETFSYEGLNKTAYCVIKAESIINEMSDLDRLCRLHQALVDSLNRKDYDSVSLGIEHLRGHFGGEMDSFYEIIEERIKGS